MLCKAGLARTVMRASLWYMSVCMHSVIHQLGAQPQLVGSLPLDLSNGHTAAVCSKPNSGDFLTMSR